MPMHSHRSARARSITRPGRLCRTAGRVGAALALLIASGADGAGTWTRLTRNAPGRVNLMLLLSDGTVLAANQPGISIGNLWYRLTPDAHGSYLNGTWTTLPAMRDTRLYCSSQVLRDGRVFVAGGEYGTGYSTAEIYDPITNSWTYVNPPLTLINPSLSSPATGDQQGFSDAISEILPNGNVMISPLSPRTLGSTVVYNPSTNLWLAGPTLYRGIFQTEASWVKLRDNSILTIDSYTTLSERYIPGTNTWVNDGVVPVAMYDAVIGELGAAFLLANGNAFFLGSTGHTAIYTPTGNANPGLWAAGPDIPNGRGTPDAPAAMMVNGKILCAVSPVSTFGDPFPTPTTFVEYDPVANAFTSVNAPNGLSDPISCYQGAMLDLPDGTVLYSHFGNDLYVYRPDGTPLAAGKPTISSITTNPDGSFHLTGTGLNGLSEGAAYGDDLQMNSNYPLVRLNHANGNVYYARTYDWSSTGVMTGNQTVTTEYKLPSNLPAGSFSVVVVGNGFASDPFTGGTGGGGGGGGGGSNTPANDSCANALPLFEGSTPYSTIEATTDGPAEPLGGLGADPQIGQDVWYLYIASCSGQVTADICQSDFDSRIAVYDGGCPTGPGTAIACNDNACGQGSRITWNALYHHLYTIRIGGTGTATGSGTITVSCASCYANCDGSTAPPLLNVLDFTCFLNRFSAGDTYANCDNSVVPPVLNINDFICFLGRFAAGCG